MSGLTDSLWDIPRDVPLIFGFTDFPICPYCNKPVEFPCDTPADAEDCPNG